MATRVVEIGNEALTAEGYRAVAWESASVRLTDAARDRVARCAQVVREAARSGRSIYGVTTGFGSNRDTSIAPDPASVSRRGAPPATGISTISLPAPRVCAMMMLLPSGE